MLKELVDNLLWNDIQKSILEYFPEEEKAMGGFKTVFGILQSLAAKQTDMLICIEVKEEEKGCENKYNVDIYGKDGSKTLDGTEQLWHLDYVPWEEFLGMEIDQAAKKEFSDSQIVAFCLWEMTFYGFDQETIRNKHLELKTENDKINAMSGEELAKYIEAMEIIGRDRKEERADEDRET